ncbi:hypothetical protein RFI_28912 [Reticulomyxa filosa]|uniref:Uncharacterized protein n=1 Tax=Reticulomyxa filosa TaxID=46433 RepID=X6M3C8_RETFI|nr:hypothetical protein RFI_28912 [Reticulomyxa filosa]|eukprot:ETO08473.1 hypothetical protein RFI_28912 [Reticulomyxa filosa]
MFVSRRTVDDRKNLNGCAKRLEVNIMSTNGKIVAIQEKFLKRQAKFALKLEFDYAIDVLNDILMDELLDSLNWMMILILDQNPKTLEENEAVLENSQVTVQNRTSNHKVKRSQIQKYIDIGQTPDMEMELALKHQQNRSSTNNIY